MSNRHETGLRATRECRALAKQPLLRRLRRARLAARQAAEAERRIVEKELRLKAKELCPPASAIRLTRRARNSTLPKAPKPPSTAAPKSGRTSRKPAFTAGMRR